MQTKAQIKETYLLRESPKNVFVLKNLVFQTNTKILHTSGLLGIYVYMRIYIYVYII